MDTTPPTNSPATSSAPMVRFDAVSIVFGDRPAAALPLMDAGRTREEIQAETGQVLGVHDCSLDVADGEIVVLMGLSGSGKSTLLRAVNGLNRVTRGHVEVRGDDGPVDIVRATPRQLRRIRIERIAMVFQQFGLLPWRSVLDNVAFGLEIAGRPAEERIARAREQLARVNLADWADRQVRELSGGMQQRVGLARAFATDAPILLMDEPFSALDPLIRTRLQDELLELQKELDRTIIFVSHDLDEAMKIGSRIAIMQGGRIVQCATPQQIVLAPATDYVADFVAHMNPMNVLRAREMMLPLPPELPAHARTVPADTPMREILALMGGDDGGGGGGGDGGGVAAPVIVTERGRPMGVIDAQAVFRALLRGGDAPQGAGHGGSAPPAGGHAPA